MLRTLIVSAVFFGLAAPSVRAQSTTDPAPPPKTPAEVAAMAEKLGASLVRVEVTPKYDKGESPGDDRYSAWRMYSSRADDDLDSGAWENWERLVQEDRPAERGGFLIAPDRVFTVDPGLHPRFIKGIRVRFGEQTVAAHPVAWPARGAGVVLQLDQPLTDAKPLMFDPTKAGPYLGVSYAKRGGEWVTRVAGLPSGVALTSDGRRFTPGSGSFVVIDRDGNPVTLTGTGDFPVDGSWKQLPSGWNMVNQSQMDDALAALEADAAKNLLRVTLNFRSPRNAGEHSMDPYGYGGAQQAEITEWNGLGLIVDDKTALVFANLKPKVTARLERVRLFSADGKEIKAVFGATLKDWGAFTVKLETPVSTPVRFSSESVLSQRGRLLLEAAATVRGETRTVYFSHTRFDAYFTGWKGEVFPAAALETVAPGSGETAYSSFTYGMDGSLIAVPIEQREQVTTQDRYSSYSGRTHAMPVALLNRVLHEGAGAIDAENRPLSEEEENRLAWLGVEMQGMDPDLARANNVMEQTNGGESGGIVTYIYPDSPATKAGIKSGDIILRLHVEGHPKPLEVSIHESPMYGMMDQFWAALDRVPEEYLDRIPKPWGSAETALTRALTDIGFGTPFVADVWRDGKVMKVPMTITQGPPTYDAAAQYKSESAGLTVKNLTYEVRRYLQLKPDDPGVIIARVERGGKASIAGLKPFETIRSINDQPVMNVKDFERLIAQGGELKLAVKRMTQGRTVKITLDPAKAGKGDKEATTSPAP